MSLGKYKGMPVLVTGHTGFKGSWLSLWLQELGAQVIGYSLPSPTHPNLFHLAQVERGMVHIIGDVRDFHKLRYTITKYQPKIIFHLAAQPLVLASYDQPKETFETNVIGTINILEAARFCSSVKSIVVITTDKCYENQEWNWGYRENDKLGGSDPYSASKAMTEIAVESYRKSFFSKEQSAAIATARAGNVIGGGDFSDNRLIPDVIKALMNHEKIVVRNPNSTRPWLYILEPLSAYLQLGMNLLDKGQMFAEAWNFGPIDYEQVTTQDLVKKAIEIWGTGEWVDGSENSAKIEKRILRLNWEKAAHMLKWRPIYDWTEALEETMKWYRAYARKSNDLHQFCIQQIHDYFKRAEKNNINWASNNYNMEWLTHALHTNNS